MARLIRTLIFGSFAAFIISSPAYSDTIAEIKGRGYLKCGVSQGLPGFSTADKNGNWFGIDVDLCRSIAAAVLGDAAKVKFTPLSAKERFTALQSGEIDVLSRNTSWTLQRDAALGIDFAGVTYYDGQGFMVHKKLNVTSAEQLLNASICVQIGTTTELNVSDFFRARKIKYKLVTFEKNDEVVAAYGAGRCDAISSDQSGLYAERTKLRVPDEHVILPERISKEPLGPAVRHGDNRFGDIVRWVLYTWFEGEELGIGQTTVASLASSGRPDVRRMLGIEGELGKNLGLDNEFSKRILVQVGNYAEVFDRNLGANSPLKIERGMNALWNKGGLHYAMPFR
ncbi:MAG: amino acid ABC transporter substrate-binding protein [Proteobacteria bacterium]|nr:MAG: amino acid ABC transporter substrate-binding protein [Pseudomonadota bacterium]